MRSASQPVPDRRRASLRQRATSAGLALAIEALIALVLILLAPRVAPVPKQESEPKTFSLSPAPDKQAAKAAAHHATHQKRAAGGAAAARTPPAAPAPVKIAPRPFTLPGLIPVDLDKADIAKIAARHGDSAPDDGSGDSAGKDSGSAYGPGEGPGGERLYNVAWYREPTHAELAGYLPNGAPPGGWAEIACRMIANYHVENCRPLGESPVGSGLARAMRQAAWQFLVRPPRVGDRVMLGTWVRIRIDFSERPAN